MKYTIHFHLMEKSFIKDLEDGVLDVIENIDVELFHGSTKSLRKRISDGLKRKGWSSKVKLSTQSNINITGINGKTAMCLQTGNMGRFYADLLKLQFLFQKGKINSAIYILPTISLAKKMGSNLANFERLVLELKLFSKVITVPILVVGIH